MNRDGRSAQSQSVAHRHSKTCRDCLRSTPTVTSIFVLTYSANRIGERRTHSLQTGDGVTSTKVTCRSSQLNRPSCGKRHPDVIKAFGFGTAALGSNRRKQTRTLWLSSVLMGPAGK